MQLDLRLGSLPGLIVPGPGRIKSEQVEVGGTSVPLLVIPNRRARRYILRLTRHGFLRLTIPRGGTLTAGRQFVAGNRVWIERQLHRHEQDKVQPRDWRVGGEVLFRGEPTRLEAIPTNASVVQLGNVAIRVRDLQADLRPEVERRLRKLAGSELPERVSELAQRNGFSVHRVSVRNQRSRWGSCSRRGTVSLNWRLLRAPAFVRDYIILHELAHLRHMNHSAAFWGEVKRLCPDFERAETWLKANSGLLR